MAARGTLTVTRDGEAVTTLHPEKRLYRVQRMPMTEAAIDSSITRDLYVSLGEPIDDQTWIRAHLPQALCRLAVEWVCTLMALGGLLAASDRRYRRLAARDQKKAAPLPRQAAAGAQPAASEGV